MKVKSVTYDNSETTCWDRFVVTFEHNGVEWVKFTQDPIGKNELKSLLNSVIEDTIARTRGSGYYFENKYT